MKDDRQLGGAQDERWRMFDTLAARYDALNHVLSFGLDTIWRRRVAARLPDRRGLQILDLATGTADQILALSPDGDRVVRVVGLDRSRKMLERGRRKIERRGLVAVTELVSGDAAAIPFGDGSFDAVTISFGIRNMPDPSLVLREMRRVLAPGGCALILEFSLPGRWLWRQMFRFYLRWIIPGWGGVLAGQTEAYRYLGRSIESFPCGAEFCALLASAGFQEIRAIPMTFGVVTLYCASNRAGA